LISGQKTDADSCLEAARRKLEGARSALHNGFFEDASSRAYYAAFHAATAALASRGLSYSSHGQVIGAFNREFIHSGRLPPEMFTMLQRLFADRQVGDYSASRTIPQETAERGVADAELLLDAVRALLSSD
jgi:uncharacterized protein (UPF0332 family)